MRNIIKNIFGNRFEELEKYSEELHEEVVDAKATITKYVNDKVINLEKRIFPDENPPHREKVMSVWDYYFYDEGFTQQKYTLEERIDILQEQVSALAKLLKVTLVKSEAKESKWITKGIKEK